MRIAIHDYAGHAFAIPLSRSLAVRGHEVRHLYCGKLIAPRGELTRRPSDPPGLSIQPVEPRREIDKSALLRRRFQEIDYARRLVAEVDRFRPQVILSGNAPLDAQSRLIRWSRANGCRFVFWLQDLLGVGADKVLRKRFGALGGLAGAHLRRLEARLLRRSDRVVSITADFTPLMREMGVAGERVEVIENWAPIDELPTRPKDNAWSRRHGLEHRRVLLYAGTLGMKHDPNLLLQLALRMRQDADVSVVVVAEGSGAERLARRRRETGAENLLLLPYQPFEELPDVLGSADVLLAVLEADAGVFSVPSKVLSGLCAARPLLLAVPAENLAARIVTGCGAGLVVEPRDANGFVAAAARLLGDPALRATLAHNGRRYAERRFGIESITDAFEGVLSPPPPSR